MWLIWSLVSILLFAFCEVFEKKGSDIREPFSETKMLVWFGIFGLLTAAAVAAFGLRETDLSLLEIVPAYPSMALGIVFYFLSLLLSFVAMKFIPVSVSVPITNTNGILAFVGAVLLYSLRGKYQEIAEEVTLPKVILVLVISAAVVVFSVIYQRQIMGGRDESFLGRLHRDGQRKKVMLFALIGIVCAALSAACDAGNSVVTYYILDGVIASNDYLFFSNLLFAFLGAAAWVFVSVREKRPYNPFGKHQAAKAIGAGLDCVGMVTYVLAVDENPFFSDPIIATYFIFTVFLSHLILREKLSKRQIFCIVVLALCICAFAFLDL